MASREAQAGGPGDQSGLEAPALDQHFDLDSLYALRSAVAAHASDLGAPADRVAHVVIVASELATNAIRHGGGGGRLRLWRSDDRIWCEVSDSGPGLADPESVGTSPPPAMATGRRGLWIVRRLSAEVRFGGGEDGTVVTAAVAVEPAGA
jgi:anti-sigma regulatory factor (Ser/Thr protein kinase)